MMKAGAQGKVYYSYKSKNRNSRRNRILFAVIIISAVLFLGNRYKQYVFFWEYNYNKIFNSFSEIDKIKSKQVKKDRLLELSAICDRYNDNNQTSPEGFSLSAKIHFELGQLYLGGTFSEAIILDRIDNITDDAKTEFTNSIKAFKKMIALSSHSEIMPQDLLTMSTACFYTNHLSAEELYKKISKIDNLDTLNNPELIRLCAILYIINGKDERGLEILKKYDKKSQSLSGQLFLANAFNIAKKYTNSILEFKSVLNKTSDSRIIKLVNMNLGKIYYNQSLFNESLSHFESALNIDAKDNQLKIWIGKNYSALGQKARAKAIWSEVLASENNNQEVKILLGLM